MKYIQIFKNEPDARMKELYLDIRNGREEGLRPRSLRTSSAFNIWGSLEIYRTTVLGRSGS